MKKWLIEFFILCIIFLVFLFAVIDLADTRVLYDCRLADISPDFPEDARKFCRNFN